MIVSLFSLNLSAQVMRAEELEKYAKENYGDKWVEAAENLGSSLVLDKNQSLTYEQIIDCGEQTKEQLYITLNHWFAESFNDANSVIKLNDKDAGVIIAKGFVGGIAQHIGGMTAYNVNIHPVSDIKLNKLLCQWGIQYKESGVYYLYSKYRDKGYTVHRPHAYTDSLGNIKTRQHMYWTEAGKRFILELYNSKVAA